MLSALCLQKAMPQQQISEVAGLKAWNPGTLNSRILTGTARFRKLVAYGWATAR